MVHAVPAVGMVTTIGSASGNIIGSVADDPWEDDQWADESDRQAPKPTSRKPRGSLGTLLVFCALFVLFGLYALSRKGPVNVAFALFFFACSAYVIFALLRHTVRARRRSAPQKR